MIKFYVGFYCLPLQRDRTDNYKKTFRARNKYRILKRYHKVCNGIFIFQGAVILIEYSIILHSVTLLLLFVLNSQ